MLVYFIRNLVNDKVYIGQTKSTIRRRYAGNIFRRATNPHLAAAYKKYGQRAFTYGPLKYCVDQAELDLWEKEYIELFQSMNPARGYNKESGGLNREVLSPEVRKRFSESQKRLCQNPEWVKSLQERSASFWKRSENREEKSHAMRVVCNTPQSRIANSLRQGGKAFVVTNATTGEVVGQWINKSECAQALELDRRKITPCLKGERRSHKGFVFKWL